MQSKQSYITDEQKLTKLQIFHEIRISRWFLINSQIQEIRGLGASGIGKVFMGDLGWNLSLLYDFVGVKIS